MATHPSILAWKIPWTEEPGGLQSNGSQRIGHDWVTKHNIIYYVLHIVIMKSLKANSAGYFLSSVSIWMRDLISFNEHNASYYNRRMIFFLISLCRQIMKHSARLLETSYNAEELCCNMVIFSFCLLNTFPLYWISDSPYLTERKECRLSIYHSFSLSSLPISCFFALGL